MSEIPRSIRDNNDPEKERDKQKALEDMDIPDSESSKSEEEEKAEEKKETEYEEMSIEELKQELELVTERKNKLIELWNKIQIDFGRAYKEVPLELENEVDKKDQELSNEKKRLESILERKGGQINRQQIDAYRKEIQDL